MFKEVIVIVFAYLIGSIPTGLLLAKAFGGVDIRETGSGNIGATNVYRTLGRKVGLLTLIGDCLKGVIPVIAAKYVFNFPDFWIAAVGLAAFLGHVYTVFLGFKGGKGVATALGVFLAASPLSVIAALVVFSLVLYKWRFVSLASVTAAACMPLLVTLISGKPETVAMTIVIAVIVIYRHRENIKRLRAGTESKFRA
ncbi:MAG TPA: glycerol-3-phosphate 1-O-acyltransferase PlsY [Geobacteraceae bacterium]|nr:glycerol-3-phosphate 1-O-acyltransferase PlsY [Geobacteraceae bacterium]